MISPAKRHVMRVKAAQEAAKTAESNVRPDASQHELLLAQLYEHTRQLKALQSIQARQKLKRELLPDYAPYVAGVLESNAGVSDDVLMTIMLWRIDAGDYPGALEIAEYAIRHHLPMPDKYQRTTATLIAEEFAEAALQGEPVPEHLLRDVDALVQDQDMPDEVRAKLHKAIGLLLEASDPKMALHYLESALKLHDKCGVKTKITQLTKQLEKNKSDPDRA